MILRNSWKFFVEKKKYWLQKKVPVALPFRLAFPSCFCQKVYASAVSERLMKKLIHFTAKPLLEVIYYQVSLHVRKYFGESLIFAFAPFFQYAFLGKKTN